MRLSPGDVRTARRALILAISAAPDPVRGAAADRATETVLMDRVRWLDHEHDGMELTRQEQAVLHRVTIRALATATRAFGDAHADLTIMRLIKSLASLALVLSDGAVEAGADGPQPPVHRLPVDTVL